RVPRPHRYRKVERGNNSNRAQWMPLLHHPMAGSFRRNCEPIKLARQTDRKVADVDHLLDFAECFGPDLAGFPGDKLRQIGLSPSQRIADLSDKFTTLGRRNKSPFLECFAGATDDLCHLVTAGLIDQRQLLTIDRRTNPDLRAFGAVDSSTDANPTWRPVQ